MSKQGMKSLFPMEDIAVMGIWELLPHIYKFRVSTESFKTLFMTWCLRAIPMHLFSLVYTRTLKCQVRLKETIEAALLFRPHVVVTVDSKGFSFRLLKQLRGNMNCPLGVRINVCTFAYVISML